MTLDRRSLDGLTGLRALAALWVICFHYRGGPFRPLGANRFLPILGYGYLGVDLFFILSGFVIWHTHSADFTRTRLSTCVRFLALRAARLYPVYLFTLGVMALLLWFAPQWGDPPLNPATYTGRLFLLHLALIQSWGFSSVLSWNYPSWSVSAEWFCYLFFPIAALLLGRMGIRGLVIGTLVLFGWIATDYFTVFAQTMNQSVGAISLVRAVPEFLLGCLLREFVGKISIESWPWTAIVTAAVSIWTVSLLTVLPAGLFAIPFFTTLILACSVPGNLVARLMSLNPLVAIGAASYSLYLIQAPVQKGARVLKAYLSPSHPWRSAGIVAAYLILLIAGAALVHVLIENPSRSWLRARINAWLPRPNNALRRRSRSDGLASPEMVEIRLALPV